MSQALLLILRLDSHSKPSPNVRTDKQQQRESDSDSDSKGRFAGQAIIGCDVPQPSPLPGNKRQTWLAVHSQSMSECGACHTRILMVWTESLFYSCAGLELERRADSLLRRKHATTAPSELLHLADDASRLLTLQLLLLSLLVIFLRPKINTQYQDIAARRGGTGSKSGLIRAF